MDRVPYIFGEAVSDLRWQKEHLTWDAPSMPAIIDLAIDMIGNGQRFVLDRAGEILPLNELTNDLLSGLQLPFDAISVLTDCEIGDPPKHAQRIVFAGTMERLIGEQAALDQRSILRADHDGQLISVGSVAKFGRDQTGMPIDWVCHSSTIWMSPLIADDGMIWRMPHPLILRDLRNTGQDADRIFLEQANDIRTIANLMVMLSTNNVESELVKLSRRQVKQSKRAVNLFEGPLDYRVLKVNGDPWIRQGPNGASRQSIGVRSHMRRGHIRRLQGGKLTWVSASLVRGSRPGFVDKHYNVSEN